MVLNATSERFGLVAVALVAATLAFTASALADYYAVGPPEAGWKPDNSNHTYCFGQEYNGNNMKDAAHAKMAGLENQTTMTKEFRNCDSGIDARFALANLPGSTIGLYTCPDRSGSYCLHAVLEYDSAAIVGYSQWLHVTCHEIGHSVGLFHGTGDCMTAASATSYGNHHQTHINNDRF